MLRASQMLKSWISKLFSLRSRFIVSMTDQRMLQHCNVSVNNTVIVNIMTFSTPLLDRLPFLFGTKIPPHPSLHCRQAWIPLTWPHLWAAMSIGCFNSRSVVGTRMCHRYPTDPLTLVRLFSISMFSRGLQACRLHVKCVYWVVINTVWWKIGRRRFLFTCWEAMLCTLHCSMWQGSGMDVQIVGVHQSKWFFSWSVSPNWNQDGKCFSIIWSIYFQIYNSRCSKLSNSKGSNLLG